MTTSKTALILIDIQQGVYCLSYYSPKIGLKHCIITGLFENNEYFGGERNNPDFELNAIALLALFKSPPANTLGYTVIHIRHNSKNPASPLHPIKNPKGNATASFVKPNNDELVIVKDTSSSFVKTDLERHLRVQGVERLIISGIMTNHCVNSTTRSACDLGFEVLLVGDACATFDRRGPDGVLRKAEEVHQYTLGDLHGEFCTVIKSTDVASLVGLTA
jgi:nicotinamidase-related amidase